MCLMESPALGQLPCSCLNLRCAAGVGSLATCKPYFLYNFCCDLLPGISHSQHCPAICRLSPFMTWGALGRNS